MKRIAAALVVLSLTIGAAVAGTGYGTLIKEAGTGPMFGLCQSAVQVSHTGDTTETTLATCAVPKDILGKNGRLLLRARVSHTNSANIKTFRVKFGDTTYLTQANTAQSGGVYSVLIANRNATNSQEGGGTALTIPVTSAVDTTASTTITITGQLANTGETVSVEDYAVEIVPAP